MADSEGPTPSQSPPQTAAEFIGSVYRASVEPQDYDELMNRWDGILTGLLSTSLNAAASETIEAQLEPLRSHFERGFDALERVGRHPSASDLIELDPRPSIGLAVDGSVTYRNEIAKSVFGEAFLAAVPTMLDQAAMQQLLERLAESHAGIEHKSDPLILTFRERGATTPGRERLMAFLPIRLDTQAADQTVGRLVAVELIWNSAAGRWLSQAFKLTSAEVEVLRHLVDGGALQGLAQSSGKSIETIRSQLKSIQRKTGTRSQTELIRLFAGFNHVPPEQNAALSSKRARTVQSHFVRLGDGRQLQFDQFGDDNGHPVVFLHGMLDGTQPPPRSLRALEAGGIRLICPWRPGFAESDPLDCPDEDRPGRFAEDIQHLLDELGISRCPLMGHLSGALFAFAAAAQFPARFSAVIAVGGAVPIVSDRQISLMSKRQRIIALSGKYTPRLLPFILRAALAQIDAGGVSKLVNAMYRPNSADGQVVADPEVADAIYRGYLATVAQGYRGFQQDGVQVLKDWSHFMHATRVPVTLLHGDADPTVRLSTVQDTLTRHPTFKLEIVPGIGQLIWYAAPHVVLDALRPHLMGS